MIELEVPAEMDALAGQKLGTSAWLVVTQPMIDGFADSTGDHQWIHVDAARAAAEMPGGRTIAHGFLTLALLPQLAAGILRIRRRSRTINYGLNKVRFTAPVQVGARVRLHQTLKASEPIEGGRRLIYEATMEIEGEARPALVAETIQLAYD